MNRTDKIRLIVVLLVVVGALCFAWLERDGLNLGLDLKGGAHIVLQAKDTPENPLRDDSIDRLLAVLRNRIDQYGVAEPIIQKSGSDRIIVDLPGIQDPAAALELIGRTAQMDFREVLDASGRNVPVEPQRRNYDSDIQFVNAQERWKEEVAKLSNASADLIVHAKETEGSLVAPAEDPGVFYLLGPVVLSGKDLVNAEMAPDSLGRMGVSLEFNRSEEHTSELQSPQ